MNTLKQLFGIKSVFHTNDWSIEQRDAAWILRESGLDKNDRFGSNVAFGDPCGVAAVCVIIGGNPNVISLVFSWVFEVLVGFPKPEAGLVKSCISK